MNIATILFTYNRSWHTQQVLEGLKMNTVLPDKLFIFQDGLKKEEHREEWQKVNELIKKVDFCDTELIISEKNKGLAASISGGVTYIMSMYDAVIVLEDDCVPMMSFMKFMYDALNKYQYEETVYCVTGYTPRMNISPNGTDAFFAGRIESWGWGTWNNRWSQYCNDAKILGRIKNDEKLNEQLQIWGPDLEEYLIRTVYGEADSWAAFWGLTVISREGVCVYPYKSLIDCIGCDGTGVHCDTTVSESMELDRKVREKFEFLDSVDITPECEEEYKKYYHCYTSEYKNIYYRSILTEWLVQEITGVHIKDKLSLFDNIAIWGTGKICDILLRACGDKEVSIIESKKGNDFYMDRKVVTPDLIDKTTQLIIIIPGYDEEFILAKVKAEMRNCVITLERLVTQEEL